MSDPVGVLSAIATVISIIDVLGRGMQELYMARERHQDVPKVMSSHCEELFNIKNILHVVQQQEILQLGSILEDLDQLHQHGKNLQRTLRKFGKERGQFQGIAHQLLHGKKSLDELNDSMGKIGRAKANISLKIQVAHVGLTQSLGEVIVVNCERTEALGVKLEELLNAGNGSRIAGLRIAGLLQSNERHMRSGDAEPASVTDNGSMAVGKQDTTSGKGTSLKVDNNRAEYRSFQLNGPIGTEGFLKIDHVTIISNTALSEAAQVNHPVSQANFDKIFNAYYARG